MRKSIVLTIAAAPLLLGTGVALSTPAAATDIKQAVKLCDANPNCTKSPGGAGGLDLKVKTSQGDKTVRCPITGPCTVTFTSDSAIVTGILAGAHRKAGKGQQELTPGLVPSGGLLDSGSGLQQQGPARTGTPRGRD
jgi:hypothetical protein